MQRNPIGFGAGMQRYAYVGNSPIAALDPLGLIDLGIIDVDWSPKSVGWFMDYYLKIAGDDDGYEFLKQLIFHFLNGHGKAFVKEDGEWGKFMKERREIKMDVFEKMQEVVGEICRGTKDSGEVKTDVKTALSALPSMRFGIL